LPWYLPSGSGDPDRHGPMIAEMRDACRLILSRDCASRRVIPVVCTDNLNAGVVVVKSAKDGV
jgi:hypothetical protein